MSSPACAPIFCRTAAVGRRFSVHQTARTARSRHGQYGKDGEPLPVPFHVECQLQDASQSRSGVTHMEPWNCPTCHTTVSTPYCPECGERPLHPRELTF